MGRIKPIILSKNIYLMSLIRYTFFYLTIQYSKHLIRLIYIYLKIVKCSLVKYYLMSLIRNLLLRAVKL